MIKTLLPGLFLLCSTAVLAQQDKDTLIYNLPVVNGKLIYSGIGKAAGRNRSTLDTIAKNWFHSYFKLDESSEEKAAIMPLSNDTSLFLLNNGVLGYKTKPGMVNISFVAIIRIELSCTDNYYSYKIDHIFFRPKSGALNAMGYQNDPEYLIKVYKRKHLGFWTAWNVSRGQIRDYLHNMNTAVRSCIASLNKAMVN